MLSSHGAGGASTSPTALTPTTSLGHLHFDRSMVAIYGGSHGGFLTAHLIGARAGALSGARWMSAIRLLRRVFSKISTLRLVYMYALSTPRPPDSALRPVSTVVPGSVPPQSCRRHSFHGGDD